MTKFRHGIFPYITSRGEERGKAVQIETTISDREILGRTDDQIMKSIEKHFRYLISSRRLYLQAENIYHGDES